MGNSASQKGPTIPFHVQRRKIVYLTLSNKVSLEMGNLFMVVVKEGSSFRAGSQASSENYTRGSSKSSVKG